jgi:hypothetical protein
VSSVVRVSDLGAHRRDTEGPGHRGTYSNTIAITVDGRTRRETAPLTEPPVRIELFSATLVSGLNRA